MRKSLLIGAVLLTAACNTVVPPGEVGILVKNTGTARGVNDYPVKVGRVFYNPFNETVYKWPTSTQNYTWTENKHEGSPEDESITVNSIQGAKVNFDLGVSITFQADSVPKMFIQFRKDADHIIMTYVRNEIRNALSNQASQMPIMDIIGGGKKMLQDSAEAIAQRKLAPWGIEISQLSIIGQIRVDEAVQASINIGLSAAQQAIAAENKVLQSKAVAEQEIATARGDSTAVVIRAAGQAEANRLNRLQITPELIQYTFANKWNGILPSVTSGAIPFFNIKP